MHYKYQFLVLLFGFITLFAGCKKDETAPDASLTAGPAVLNVGKEAGSIVFNIVSNQKWTVSSDQAWASLSTNAGSNDGIITISYEANPQAVRQATITISGGGIEAKIKLNQSAGLEATASISLNPLGYAKGTFTISVQSNTGWKLGLQDSTWMQSNLKSGLSGTTTVTVNFGLNATTGQRNNAINFYDLNNNLLQSLPVSQLNSTQANLLFTGKWGVYREYIVKVKPTGDSLYRDLIISEPCELDDWLQIGPDTITFFQGPVPCSNPKQTEKIKANFNPDFTQISVTSPDGAETYQIQMLTTDSLIIESLPPYPRSLKAKRWMVKKP